MSKQPRDDGNAAIPVLSYRPQRGQRVVFTTAPARSAEFSPSVRVVSIYATDSCFIELGNASVVANASSSHFIPGGFYMDISLGSDNDARASAKYISVVSENNEGTLYVSERE
jgi:hypothetical protein